MGKKSNIIECRLWAANKGGKCLENIYKGTHVKMLWECSLGHQWEASWANIKNSKSWCPACSSTLCDIKELQKHAENKNGRLVSTKYINALTNILWECEKGHKWEACWSHVNNNHSWCPECSSFKTERKCKELLEQKLGFELKKTNFKCESNCYQWDGYNEEHKIAFEYHGYQHYEYPNYWHKTLAIYEKAIQRDLDKVQYAKENNIRLIIIPYTEEKNLEEYISKYIIS
jgi:hypothetical protein